MNTDFDFCYIDKAHVMNNTLNLDVFGDAVYDGWDGVIDDIVSNKICELAKQEGLRVEINYDGSFGSDTSAIAWKEDIDFRRTLKKLLPMIDEFCLCGDSLDKDEKKIFNKIVKWLPAELRGKITDLDKEF